MVVITRNQKRLLQDEKFEVKNKKIKTNENTVEDNKVEDNKVEDNKVEDNKVEVEDNKVEDGTKNEYDNLSEHDYNTADLLSEICNSNDESNDESNEYNNEYNNESNESNESNNESNDESNESNDESNDEYNDNKFKIDKMYINKLIKRVIKNYITKNDNTYGSLGNEHDQFVQYTEQIYDGSFFERVPLEDRHSELKDAFSPDQIKQLSSQMGVLKEKYYDSCPSIIDILKMDIPLYKKQELLEKVYLFTNSELLSSDYYRHLKNLESSLSLRDPSLLELERKLKETSESSYKERILKSNMSFHNKSIVYKKLEIMETFSDDDSEYAKYKTWIDQVLRIPFGNYTLGELNIKQVRDDLDKNMSFLEKPKDQVINIVSKMLRTSSNTSGVNAIGLYGSKGVGKSKLCQNIAKALGREFNMISLGGESDVSILSGHHFTYTGSTPGRLVDILIQSKTMNPVILLDELDKVSETRHGQEIIGTLIHLTDRTTNSQYSSDRYFSGLEFDLSKILFIFTYNDPSKIDPILADRIYKIHVEDYTSIQKLEITKRHLITSVLDEYNFSSSFLQFDEDTIKYIISISKSDQGMRDIKSNINIIVSRINTLLVTNKEDNIVRLKYAKLYDYYDNNKECYTVLKEHVDILLESSINEVPKNDVPFGMYT